MFVQARPHPLRITGFHRRWRTSRPRVVCASGETYDAVVVGGGISGLSTARILTKDYTASVPKVLLTEARQKVGGNVITGRNEDGYIWEEGPNSFAPNDETLKMAVIAGVGDELVFGDPKEPRFVYWDEKLRKTPSGPDALTFDLLTPWGKIRAGLGAIGIKASMPDKEESIEEFIKRNLGDEVLARLIEPFCSGVYAGDPSKLSMKAAFGKIHALEESGGSLIGGSLKLFNERRKNPTPPRDPTLPPKPPSQTVASFREGLVALPNAIAQQLSDQIRLEWKLEKISKDDDGMLLLVYSTPDGQETIRSKSVALTTPAYVAANILQDASPKAAKALKDFDYPPVAAVSVSYRMEDIREDRLDPNGRLPGFGQLHPRSQGVVTLGTIYSSSLFPDRAPKGYVNLLNYIGGAGNRGIVNQTEEELVHQVDKDLRKMLIKPNASKAQKLAVRVWPRAIPQFNLGHLERLSDVREGLKDAGLENVLLGGNHVCGVAFGKCIEFSFPFAKEIATRVRDFDNASALRSQRTTSTTA